MLPSEFLCKGSRLSRFIGEDAVTYDIRIIQLIQKIRDPGCNSAAAAGADIHDFCPPLNEISTDIKYDFKS